MRDGHDLLDRQHLAGDVGRPGDGDQGRRARGELGPQGDEGRPLRRTGQDAAVAPALPGQQVGVVLDVEYDDVPCPARARDAAGEQVQRVGGVAGEDHDVVAAGADERRRPVARARSYSAVLTCEA